jgi:hypothetical protein
MEFGQASSGVREIHEAHVANHAVKMGIGKSQPCAVLNLEGDVWEAGEALAGLLQHRRRDVCGGDTARWPYRCRRSFACRSSSRSNIKHAKAACETCHPQQTRHNLPRHAPNAVVVSSSGDVAIPKFTHDLLPLLRKLRFR